MTTDEICAELMRLKNAGEMSGFVVGFIEADETVFSASGGKPLDKLGLCQAMSMSIYLDKLKEEDAQETIEDTDRSPE